MYDINMSIVFINYRSICIFWFIWLSNRKYVKELNRMKIFFFFLEVITYLLSLREHGDTHLRGACANLLAKLIETTVRLLTISPPISSLTNSFNNQCSLVSTDSQDSSRLGLMSDFHWWLISFFFEDIQLGILAELLSTFRLYLNDKNARVIHVSLNALRTLLPVLLTNSHALTIIAMELLEDAIQHSSSSYVLAKVEENNWRSNLWFDFSIGCSSSINWWYWFSNINLSWTTTTIEKNRRFEKRKILLPTFSSS